MLQNEWKLWKAALIGLPIGMLANLLVSLFDPTHSSEVHPLVDGAIGGAVWGAIIASARNLWVRPR